MSGHSKWSKLKHQKQAQDVKKSGVFSKISRQITLAVIEGGGIADPELNVKLRLAIEKARQNNIPKDNIQRAIEKGAGPNKVQLSKVQYGIFAPYATVLMVVAATDNPNRTYNEVRNVAERHGAKLGDQGAVSHLFKQCGTAYFDRARNSDEDVLKFAERIGAGDLEQSEESIIVYFPFEHLGRLDSFLGNLKIEASGIENKSLSPISLDKEKEKEMNFLIENLEKLEDVQDVYTNL